MGFPGKEVAESVVRFLEEIPDNPAYQRMITCDWIKQPGADYTKELEASISGKEEQLDCARKLIQQVRRAKRLHLDIVSSEGWPLMGYLLTIHALLQVMFKDELEVDK
jgi:prolyl-tRNA synthetase